MEKKRLIEGVYRVFDESTGESFVGFSRNVEGTMKRLRFELTLNACSYRPLQDFWNKHGELKMELVEEYEPENEMTAIEAEAHLQAKLFAAKAKFGEGTREIQTGV